MAKRLASGELQKRVARELDSRGNASPGEIAAALGSSSGGVGYALGALQSKGAARKVSDKPVRYAPTGITPEVHSGAAIPAPRAAAKSKRKPAGAKKPEPAGYKAPAKVTGPVARPNGTTYQPRALAGKTDVDALRKLRAAKVPALLYGPPGTGKTSVVEAAFDDAITVQGDADTTVGDFVGEYVQLPDGRFEFAHGPLVRAMKEGRALFIDDATLISPTVLAVVYPAMDGRGEIVIKANAGEVITAAPGFYVIAGHNPGVHGAVLTDALSSRFTAHIKVSSDYALAEQLGVSPKAVRVAKNLAKRAEHGEVSWAPQLRELLGFKKLAEVLGEPAAAGNLVNIAPEEDREAVAEAVRDSFGKAPEPLALGEQVTF
ncbi:AAA family ATPase [Saccharopolyspora griseoalba]|uniref:AAA family ATPase n=1 Tax=Saccharopolyspora griseoalba TaxID=1431848 RepID=A0ABW2LWB6_9PSEU